METNYMCLLPKKWLVYSQALLEVILYNNIRDHWKCYNTFTGTTVEINGVSAAIVDYHDILWFRLLSEDYYFEPNDKYFIMYLTLCL